LGQKLDNSYNGPVTQVLPLKHLPSTQSQDLTWWLAAGEQPHEPIVHVFGKASTLPQHKAVVIIPPELMHACSSGDRVNLLSRTKRMDAPIITNARIIRKNALFFPFFIILLSLYSL